MAVFAAQGHRLLPPGRASCTGYIRREGANCTGYIHREGASCTGYIRRERASCTDYIRHSKVILVPQNKNKGSSIQLLVSYDYYLKHIIMSKLY